MADLKPVQPSPEALKQGYETHGVHYGALVGLLVLLTVIVAVIMVVSGYSVLWMSRRAAAAEPAPSNLGPAPLQTALPPLQPSPGHPDIAADDLVLMHQHEDAVFGELGWKIGPDEAPQVPDQIVTAVANRGREAK